MSVNLTMHTQLAISGNASVFLMVFTALQVLLGSTANGIVIYTIFKTRGLTARSEDRLIFNLAIADFLAVTTFLPLHVYVLWEGKISMRVQRSYEALMSLVCFYGGNAVMAIACDRFVAIVLPLRHWKLMSKRVILFMTVFTFVAAVFMAILDFLSPAMAHKTQKLLIQVLFIPYNIVFLTALAVIYGFILYNTLKQVKQISKQRRSIGVQFRNYTSQILVKATVKITILVVLYYATYLPLMAYVHAYSSLVENQKRIAQATARTWIYSFVFLNCTANPYVYALQTMRFRIAFYKVLPNCIRSRANSSTDVSSPDNVKNVQHELTIIPTSTK